MNRPTKMAVFDSSTGCIMGMLAYLDLINWTIGLDQLINIVNLVKENLTLSMEYRKCGVCLEIQWNVLIFVINLFSRLVSSNYQFHNI